MLYGLTNNKIIRYLPLWVYLAVYILTYLVAMVPLYFSYLPLTILLECFSGTRVPTNFSSEQNIILLVLSFVVPILIALSYSLGIRIKSIFLQSIVINQCNSRVAMHFSVLVFLVVAGVGIWELIRAGSFDKLWVWFDYGAWIQARYELFSTLGFFNFVNFYLIIPLAALCVIFHVQGSRLRYRILKCVVILVPLILTIFLFQKRPFIFALLMILSAILLRKILSETWQKRTGLLCIAGAGVLVVGYFVLIVVPVYFETSRNSDEVLKLIVQKQQIEESESKTLDAKIVDKVKQPKTVPKTSDAKVEFGQKRETVPSTLNSLQANSFVIVDKVLNVVSQQQEEKRDQIKSEIVSFLNGDRKIMVFLSALLAPLTRTSAPAMYYPVVFPKYHDFFGLDFGQDILGWGRMPNDNSVVWNYMYPNLPGGNIAAPFQFVLYSQVGVIWAIFITIALGVVMGMVWQNFVLVRGSRIWRSLIGSMFLIFSIYIAMDSIRGSLLASYGIIWGCLFICLFFLIVRLLVWINVKLTQNLT